MTKTTIGLIGLGKMGGNLGLQAVEKGYSVVGLSRSYKPHLKRERFIQVNDLEELINRLTHPRIVLMLVPAGSLVDHFIERVTPLLSKGDVLADCGNSYWGDSIRRSERLEDSGIHFIDCGTSGGWEGARYGASFMLGGHEEGVKIIEPVLKDLAVIGGFVHAGPSGSGHFVKLVHNGIEFGMLQAIGEGMNLLSKYREKLDLTAILKCWENGSVIRSWLVELMRKQLQEQKGFENVPTYVEDTGEVNWLINDAMHMEVSIPVIAQSVMQLIASREKDNISAKAIAMMRHGFGGHPFGEDEEIKKERVLGQVNGFFTRKSVRTETE
jgi:6-phosphogluconate dehydrogenase